MQLWALTSICAIILGLFDSFKVGLNSIKIKRTGLIMFGLSTLLLGLFSVDTIPGLTINAASVFVVISLLCVSICTKQFSLIRSIIAVFFTCSISLLVCTGFIHLDSQSAKMVIPFLSVLSLGICGAKQPFLASYCACLGILLSYLGLSVVDVILVSGSVSIYSAFDFLDMQMLSIVFNLVLSLLALFFAQKRTIKDRP